MILPRGWFLILALALIGCDGYTEKPKCFGAYEKTSVILYHDGYRYDYCCREIGPSYAKDCSGGRHNQRRRDQDFLLFGSGIVEIRKAKDDQ